MYYYIRIENVSNMVLPLFNYISFVSSSNVVGMRNGMIGKALPSLEIPSQSMVNRQPSKYQLAVARKIPQEKNLLKLKRLNVKRAQKTKSTSSQGATPN